MKISSKNLEGKNISSSEVLPDGDPSLKAFPKRLQNSKFTRLLHKGDVYCIFNTLSMRMVFGGKILADLFELFKDNISLTHAVEQGSANHSIDDLRYVVHELAEKQLLIPDTIADAKMYKELFSKALALYQIQHMYFIPTSSCNFRCSYCFVKEKERMHTAGHMTTSTAEAAITTLMRLSKVSGNASITFYGGEPLLNSRTTYFSLRFLKQLTAEGKFPNGCRISMVTNGSLIDSNAITVFMETQPSIGVSIDGPQKLHDAARLDDRGNGTFHAAFRGYKRLQDAGLNPGISCTLTGHNIDHIDEVVDFIISDLKPTSMGFNILLPQTGEKNSCPGLDHEFSSKQLIRAFKRLRKAGIYEDRLMRRIRPFLSQRIHFKPQCCKNRRAQESRRQG